ncbi:unnamed protein product [Amoebophrya sp. A25]|nr:unnamed protein product [Amoebophrya sp. A25]|eukprot:GSA25T00021416001.1
MSCYSKMTKENRGFHSRTSSSSVSVQRRQNKMSSALVLLAAADFITTIVEGSGTAIEREYVTEPVAASLAGTLKAHNVMRCRHRSSDTKCESPDLQWSAILAKTAKLWTDEMTTGGKGWGHFVDLAPAGWDASTLNSLGAPGWMTKIGENLATGFTTGIDATAAWYAVELHCYDFDAHSGKGASELTCGGVCPAGAPKSTNCGGLVTPQFGHMTQVIWSDTRYVGCAYKEWNGQKYHTCHYWPSGNGFETTNVFPDKNHAANVINLYSTRDATCGYTCEGCGKADTAYKLKNIALTPVPSDDQYACADGATTCTTTTTSLFLQAELSWQVFASKLTGVNLDSWKPNAANAIANWWAQGPGLTFVTRDRITVDTITSTDSAPTNSASSYTAYAAASKRLSFKYTVKAVDKIEACAIARRMYVEQGVPVEQLVPDPTLQNPTLHSSISIRFAEENVFNDASGGVIPFFQLEVAPQVLADGSCGLCSGLPGMAATCLDGTGTADNWLSGLSLFSAGSSLTASTMRSTPLGLPATCLAGSGGSGAASPADTAATKTTVKSSTKLTFDVPSCTSTLLNDTYGGAVATGVKNYVNATSAVVTITGATCGSRLRRNLLEEHSSSDKNLRLLAAAPHDFVYDITGFTTAAEVTSATTSLNNAMFGADATAQAAMLSEVNTALSTASLGVTVSALTAGSVPTATRVGAEVALPRLMTTMVSAVVPLLGSSSPFLSSLPEELAQLTSFSLSKKVLLREHPLLQQQHPPQLHLLLPMTPRRRRTTGPVYL